jgi:biotin carboxyl carrier protein
MTYEVEVNGAPRQVVVSRTGDRFAVTVDGRPWTVDAVRIDAHNLSLIVDAPRGETTTRSYDVTVTPDPASAHVTVRIGAIPVAVALNARRSRRSWRGKDAGGHAAGGPQRITAPMPGKIVRVLVQPGATVRARQPLIIVEAMKMENEVRAGAAGTVGEILIREGMLVEAGTLLVTIQ